MLMRRLTSEGRRHDIIRMMSRGVAKYTATASVT